MLVFLGWILAVLGGNEFCSPRIEVKPSFASLQYTPPLSATNALEIQWEVVWDNVQGLQQQPSNGIFLGVMPTWVGGTRGYGGPHYTSGDEYAVRLCLWVVHLTIGYP